MPSLDWPLCKHRVINCHESFTAAVPGMADAQHRKQQLIGYLPSDDEQVCQPNCVLVSEDGTELPAHQSFLSMHSKELGRMLAVAKHADQGSTRLQVSCCVCINCMFHLLHSSPAGVQCCEPLTDTFAMHRPVLGQVGLLQDVLDFA